MNMLEKIELYLRSINHYVLKFSTLLSCLTLGVMTVIVLVAVFFRYVLGDSLEWSEELSKFLMIWMTFVAAPLGLSQGRHIGIQFLPNALKGRPRLYHLTLLFGHAIAVILMIIFIKQGIALAWIARIQKAASMDLSFFWVYLAIPFGSVMIFAVVLEQFVADLKKTLKKYD